MGCHLYHFISEIVQQLIAFYGPWYVHQTRGSSTRSLTPTVYHNMGIAG